jgi:hypothetical protein
MTLRLARHNRRDRRRGVVCSATAGRSGTDQLSRWRSRARRLVRRHRERLSGYRVAGANRQSIGTIIIHSDHVSGVALAGGVLSAEALISFSTEEGLGDVSFASRYKSCSLAW